MADCTNVRLGYGLVAPLTAPLTGRHRSGGVGGDGVMASASVLKQVICSLLVSRTGKLAHLRQRSLGVVAQSSQVFSESVDHQFSLGLVLEVSLQSLFDGHVAHLARHPYRVCQRRKVVPEFVKARSKVVELLRDNSWICVVIAKSKVQRHVIRSFSGLNPPVPNRNRLAQLERDPPSTRSLSPLLFSSLGTSNEERHSYCGNRAHCGNSIPIHIHPQFPSLLEPILP